MRKLIATVLATGALAAGGAAQAQDFGSVIANILGFGAPAYSQNYGYNYGYGSPAVVAPQTYRDAYGRQFYYDQYGRQVFLNNAPSTIVGYDAWGRPVYGQPRNYAWGSSWDSDGDGIANTRDRWPNDSRYW